MRYPSSLLLYQSASSSCSPPSRLLLARSVSASNPLIFGRCLLGSRGDRVSRMRRLAVTCYYLRLQGLIRIQGARLLLSRCCSLSRPQRAACGLRLCWLCFKSLHKCAKTCSNTQLHYRGPLIFPECVQFIGSTWPHHPCSQLSG